MEAACNGTTEFNGTLQFSEFNKFGESDKSLKHGLESKRPSVLFALWSLGLFCSRVRFFCFRSLLDSKKHTTPVIY